jgi:hypothetical protein
MKQLFQFKHKNKTPVNTQIPSLRQISHVVEQKKFPI